MLTLHRPALLIANEHRLDAECRSARWIHHRLLDFEDEHQRVLDAAAEAAAPGIRRVGRILALLARRARRAERATSGSWCPAPRLELAAELKARLPALRKQRDADPRWKAAIGWADEQIGEPKQVRRRRAKDPARVKRRKTETDEAWAKRFALLTTDETDEHYAAKIEKAPRRTRREAYRAKLYAERRCYWGTWNALVRSVDQARADVLRRRKQGLPAEWRRPKYRDPVSLAADAGGFRVVDRGPVWWTIEMRIGTCAEWVSFRAKCGNWHDMPPDVSIETAKLIRRKDGERWSYSFSLTVLGAQKRKTEWATSGVVAFDWGHREHGHDNARDGIRAFVWRGDDGATGDVLIPPECRACLDTIDTLKSRIDQAYDARRATRDLPERSRYGYRRRLMTSGVRTEEETLWLRWEMRYERRVASLRERFQNLRKETYLSAVRMLRQRYAVFAFEGEQSQSIKDQQTDDQMRHRARANRDLTARYEFVSICERLGAEVTTVSARNTTRECPDCGQLTENGPELLAVCFGCGRVRDKDRGAARVILARAQEALANHAAE